MSVDSLQQFSSKITVFPNWKVACNKTLAVAEYMLSLNLQKHFPVKKNHLVTQFIVSRANWVAASTKECLYTVVKYL